MMIVTLQTHGTLAPTLSVHGGMIKIDLGALLLEMDTEEFKNIIVSLTTQAAELHVPFGRERGAVRKGAWDHGASMRRKFKGGSPVRGRRSTA